MARNGKSTVSAPPDLEFIRVVGARTHNLKGVGCNIPMGCLTVVTGVSGSGKSSLAFDTIFAEGQRRYVESLSTYARQFVARMPRPDVESISHIPPAIALEQRNSVKNARSTIGTATEINDYLRLLFARVGRPTCPECGVEARRDTPQTATALAFRWPAGTRLYVLAPFKLDDPSRFEATLDEMRRQGYDRLWIDGALVDTSESRPAPADSFAVLVDRLAIDESARTRLADAIAQAFRLGRGSALLRTTGGEELLLRDSLGCPGCGRKFRPAEPHLFSFSHALGACPRCEGFGRVTGIDWDKVIPDPTKTLNERCIAPFNGETNSQLYDWLRDFKFGIPFNVPFKDLSAEHRQILLHGKGEWWGVAGFFRWLEEKRYKVQNRVTIARYRGYTECPECGGTRLAPDGRSYRIGNATLGDLARLPVSDLRRWFERLELTPQERQTAERPLGEVLSRLGFLEQVGLGYLTLGRQTRTLSGGESQRINLATALGSALTDTLYVLDEPTVGLHPRDTARLIGILRRLTDLGNTVVVVEHDLDVIRAADHLVDIGPAAGKGGGTVVYEGRPGNIETAGNASRTAAFIGHPTASGRPEVTKRRRPTGHLRICGAHENNLQYLNVDIPLGVLCAVTGVSGSGKSSLIKSCLWAPYRRSQGDTKVDPGKVVSLEGLEQVSDILLIDQEPIGRSARSNPATYLKAFDGIRKLLADTPGARARGLTAGEFSFNIEGGRCETCEGTGVQIIDMQFLADVEVVCEKCEGRRFQDRILEAEWRGRNINGILGLTVAESLEFFAGLPRILAGLQPLADVGLGYLELGQSTSTLSGGEAQRLKLASCLYEARKASGSLLLLDEPTTGLHPADLQVLLGVFARLLDTGYSIVVIEHNLELIRAADWIIDLGPDSGENGGRLVAQGTPENVAMVATSLTGRFLARGESGK